MSATAIITGLGLLASLIGKGVSSYKNRKYQKEADEYSKEKEDENRKLQLKNAMARSLGVNVMPYTGGKVERPELPSTAWSDIMAGLGQAATQVGSSRWAEKMFPISRR